MPQNYRKYSKNTNLVLTRPNKYLQLYRIGSFMNTVCKKTFIVKIY